MVWLTPHSFSFTYSAAEAPPPGPPAFPTMDPYSPSCNPTLFFLLLALLMGNGSPLEPQCSSHKSQADAFFESSIEPSSFSSESVPSSSSIGIGTSCHRRPGKYCPPPTPGEKQNGSYSGSTCRGTSLAQGGRGQHLGTRQQAAWNAISPPQFMQAQQGADSTFAMTMISDPPLTLGLGFSSWGFQHHSKLRCYAWYQ